MTGRCAFNSVIYILIIKKELTKTSLIYVLNIFNNHEGACQQTPYFEGKQTILSMKV